MNIQVLYFASLREAVGVDREVLDLGADIHTVGALRVWLCTRGAQWAEAFAEGRNVRAALNQRMSHAATMLEEGAELAFFPPVTGG